MKNEIARKRDYLRTLPYGILSRRDEEGDWVARVVELPGCTAHGSTLARAIENLDEVMALWFEDALTSGSAIPEPRNDEGLPSGKWLHKKLIELAGREQVSFNQLVTSVLSEAVGLRYGPERVCRSRAQEAQLVRPAKRAVAIPKRAMDIE